MNMLVSQTSPNSWLALISVSVLLFFACTFAIPSGYSYGAALLLLISLAQLMSRPAYYLSYEDKALAFLLLIVFLIALAAFLIHGDELNSLDQSSRYLLFIPILLLFLRTTPSSRALWLGVLLGTLSSLGLALWQRYIESNPRPDGFMTSAIPFGNLSLMAGIFCLCGVTWANTQDNYAKAWKTALYGGFLAGLYVSFLSGSRGGWLAIPIVLIIFLVAYLRKNKLKAVTISALLLLSAISAIGLSMQQEIAIRYDAAITQVRDYTAHGDAKSSVGLRLEAWRTAIGNIAERPLLGWSYKDYDARLAQLAADHKADVSVTTLANTHNNFLEVWLHQGLFGFLAFLALFIVPFWFFCKRLRSDDHTVQAFALGGACLLACFFVFSLTQVILGRNNGVIFFGLSLVIFWGCMRNAEQRAAATAAGQ